MTDTRWAIVGTGDVSRFIAPDFARTSGAELVAVASRDIDRARAFADGFDVPLAYGSVDELLDDPDVDAVYIATPHATHLEFGLRALEAGKHVLVEKPVALDGGQARTLEDAAAHAGRFVMEAMWMRFGAAYRHLLADLEAGVIGEVTSVRASFGMPFPSDRGSRWSGALRGSTLLDQGIYPVTLALDVLGVPESITASGVVRPDGVDLREHMTFEYADGGFAHLAASMTEFADPTATISGTSGWIHLPFPFWAGSSYSITTGEHLFSPRAVATERRGNGYVPMIEAASEAIRDGLLEHPLHTWEHVHRTFTVLDRVRTLLHA